MFSQVSFILLALGPILTSAGLLPGWRSFRTTAMCNVQGYADSDNNYFWSSSKNLTSYSGCSARCVADDSCESFGFGDEWCMLFDEPLRGNFAEDDGSGFVFFDSSCVQDSGNASAPAVSSTSTSAAAVPTVAPFLNTTSPADTVTASNAGSNSSAATTGVVDDSALVATPVPYVGSVAATSPGYTAATAAPSGDASASPATATDSSTISGFSNTTLGLAELSTTTTTSSSVVVPAGCDIPATYTITSFSWFNSSHNLDCVHPNYANGSRVCWNDRTKKLCDPAAAGAGAGNCTCRAYCSPGMPRAAYQPPGFGPADTVSVGFGGINRTCAQSNPPAGLAAGTTSRAADEVGAGGVDCGSSGGNHILSFYGDSTGKRNGTFGSIDFQPPGVTCGGQAAVYGANFTLRCIRDRGGNATCTTKMPLTLSLTGFSS